MADIALLYADAIKEVDARYRFPQIDNLLSAPSDLEKKAAIYDALGAINAAAPITDFSVEAVLDPNGNPTLKMLVYLGAARNILRLLLTDWTANGFNLNVEEFSVENRRGDYDSLYNQIDSQFQAMLQTFKESAGKYIKSCYVGGANPLISFRSSSITRLRGLSRFR